MSGKPEPIEIVKIGAGRDPDVTVKPDWLNPSTHSGIAQAGYDEKHPELREPGRCTGPGQAVDIGSLPTARVPEARVKMKDLKGTYGAPNTSYTSDRLKCGIAYGARALWQRSPHSSPRPGKPATWRRGAGEPGCSLQGTCDA